MHHPSRQNVTTSMEWHLRFSGYCWRSKNEVFSNFALWDLKHDKRSIRGQAHTFVNLLEAGTGVPRDCLLAAMDDRVGWRKSYGGSTEVNLVVVVVVYAVFVSECCRFSPHYKLCFQLF